MIHMLQFLEFADCNPMKDSIHCILNAWLRDNNTDILMVAVCQQSLTNVTEWVLVVFGICCLERVK